MAGKELASAYIKLIPTTDNIKSEMESIFGDAGTKAGTAAGHKLSSALGKAASVSVKAVTATSAAVAAFGKASVSTGMEFDAAMSQVAATMGTTTDQIEGLRDLAMEMGSATAFSATEAAEALNYMALAGYDAKTSTAMLPNVLNLAAAGGIDLASASDMVTDAQSALGLSLEETTAMVDQMAKTASSSNTSVSQLGEAILTVGGTASYMAGGIEEINAVLGVLADNGIKGSEAGTHLRNMLLSLSSPTDDAAAMIEKLGLEIFDAQGNMRSFSDIFPELNAAMADMTDQEKLDAFSTLFNSRDIAAATALLNTTTERWEELGGAIENSAGAAEQMANTQLDNLEGDVTLFKSALEGAQIVISDQLTPTLREFVQFGTGAVGELSRAFQEDGLGGAMGALGEILTDGLGMIMEMLPELVSAGGELLTALVTGITSMLPEMTQTAVDILLELCQGLTDNLPTLIPAAAAAITQIIESLTSPESISGIISAALALIEALGAGLINSLPELLKQIPAIVNGIVLAFDELMYDILGIGVSIVQGVWEGIQSQWTTFWNNVAGFFRGIVEGVKNTLGIHSPSTVFAGIGQNMGAGLREGLMESAAGAQSAMRAVVDGTLTEADRLTARLGAGLNISASASWYIPKDEAARAGQSGQTPGEVTFRLVDNAGNLLARAASGPLDAMNGTNTRLRTRGLAV